MKTVKLKPLYLKNTDILIQPPDFLTESFDNALKNNSPIPMSSIENLTSLLRGRSFKPVNTVGSRFLSEEKESVEKLSFFKERARRHTRSPLTKRYTFRRTLSNLANIDGSTIAQATKRIEEAKETPTFESLLRSLTSTDRARRKTIEQEMQKYTESNKAYESNLAIKMQHLELNQDINTRQITKVKLEVENCKNQMMQLEKEYKDSMNSITLQNTEQALSAFKVNGKKKTNMEVKEDREYFTLKQRIRTLKSDIHTKFIENLEKSQGTLERYKFQLESLQENKKIMVKEKKEMQEILISFYCKTLKDGMDLREDGIKWCIKATWKLSQPIPFRSFPKFLDDESAQYLLRTSQLELEIENLKEKLNKYREQIKRDSSQNRLAKTQKELFNVIRSRLKQITQKSQFLNSNAIVTEDTLSTSYFDASYDKYTDINSLKVQIREKEKLKNILTDQEVKRVVQNYKPEADNNIGIMHIIRALVGDKVRVYRAMASSIKTN